MNPTLNAWRRPVRYLKRQFSRQARIDQPSSPTPSILDSYSKNYPSPQTALGIFRGEWASKLPSQLAEYSTGSVPLFEDDRIAEGITAIGGVADQHVLELGPLEGGHSYMLERAGAASVLAIESNSRAYLKCLIAKELLGLQKVRFLHGDFMEYFRQAPPSFDFVLASGVLYHQREPVELIYHLAQVTRRVVVWTHYFDGAIIHASLLLAPKFPGSEAGEYKGFRHTLHRQEYQASLAHPGYCGGSAEHSFWLQRDELLQAFRYFGFSQISILREDPRFPNGPCILFTAQKD
jgi:hypothetical protein